MLEPLLIVLALIVLVFVVPTTYEFCVNVFYKIVDFVEELFDRFNGPGPWRMA